MRTLFLILTLACAALAQPGFKPLFNGTNLDDFAVDTPGLWSVDAGGEIVGRSPGLKYNDFLRTKKLYSHFILKVKFKMTDASGNANSGVQFRSKPMPDSHEVIGYQADMGQNYWGCLYDESRRKKVLVQAPPESLAGLDKAGWNEYVIEANGPRIRIELNGRTTVDYTEAEPGIETSGFIALQLHSGPAFEMRFKELMIRELPDPRAWVESSNRHAKVLTDLMAKFAPESAGSTGVDGLDELVTDLSTAQRKRSRAATVEAIAELERRRKAERDPLVVQDLDIMIADARLGVRNADVADRLRLPYFALSRMVFGGLRALLDDQVAPERRKAALVRLKRYAGMEAGYRPIAAVAEERTREGLASPKPLLPPFRTDVEQNLAQSAFFMDGLAQLFDKYKIEGYKDSLETLKGQVSQYNEFLKSDVLPRSTTDFRLPPELYAGALENFGVDIPPAQLVSLARNAFVEIQAEMQTVAARLAKERGWAFTGYRQVMRELKKDQLVGDAILPHYRERLGEIEAIVRREKLVSLPRREARIRIASAAESAASPAPNMRPPRLLGNKGEMGEFVLPLNNPAEAGKALPYDDFTFRAASWSLAAHELRPGHEMQFAKMVERGVSNARAIFAFNSTNVEGWGLYSEYIMLPYMPLEGQLASLDFRLLRAARAFLDPELQMGKVTLPEATRVLMEDVVTSEAMAKQETDRYTFRMPGQATSYFYGYVRLVELRKEIEQKLGARFNAMAFHDFILDQGLLPPALLRRAALEHFK
jgi:uncharacterized protein (DUF885 family)